MIDTIADAVAEHVDMEALLALTQRGVPVRSASLAEVGSLNSPDSSTVVADPRLIPEADLHHHGDADLGTGLIDLAVNVRVAARTLGLVREYAVFIESGLDYTVNAALRRLGYSRAVMTAHGFRAMASTLLNEQGHWNPDAIERQLGHVVRTLL